MDVMEWVIGSVAFIALGMSIGTLVMVWLIFKRRGK